MTLTSTIAGKDSNSYVDLTYANAYFSGHYSSDKATKWAALVNDQKNHVLVAATRVLETIKVVEESRSELEYIPAYNRLTGGVTFFYEDKDNVVRSNYYQKLQFPRNVDIDTTTGLFFIPEEIKMAQCEQAIFLLDFDEDSIAAKLSGVTNDVVTAGQISIRKQISSTGSMIAPAAYEFLKPYLRTATKMRRA
jgi:hypothetical protein